MNHAEALVKLLDGAWARADAIAADATPGQALLIRDLALMLAVHIGMNAPDSEVTFTSAWTAYLSQDLNWYDQGGVIMAIEEMTEADRARAAGSLAARALTIHRQVEMAEMLSPQWESGMLSQDRIPPRLGAPSAEQWMMATPLYRALTA